MKIICKKLGSLLNNCFVVFDEVTKDAVIIDATGSELLDVIKEKNLNLKYILLTHGHYDHILNAQKIKIELDAKIVLHKDDTDLLPYDIVASYVPSLAHIYKEAIADILVDDGDIISFGDLKAEFIHTKGHTKGSCCIKIEDNLFTGDTLFKGECGRCDLYDGDFNMMLQSLKKLHDMPGNYNVYPGHEEFTTLDIERKNNKYILAALRKLG